MPTPVIHTQPDERIVVYLSTSNLFDLLPAAYNSLLAFNPGLRVFLLIDKDTFPHKLPKQIKTVNVASQDLFPPTGPNFRTRYTYMILLKAAMSKIFPDLHRILVLDADTLVQDDISALWNVDLTGSYFAAVTEPKSFAIRGYPYPNFGAVMLNLDLLRSSGMDDIIISDLNTTQYHYPEQDSFVRHCGQRFVTLPSEYNDTSTGFKITAPTDRHTITHYAGFDDWSCFKIVRHWQTHTTPPNRSVVYMGNRHYYPMLITAAKSLLSHSQVDDIYFLIEDDAFPDQPDIPSFCHCINVRNQSIFSASGPNIHQYYTYMTLMRAALTKLIPNRDRVLLLDPDTVVVDDISPIWNFDIQRYYFAAVPETRNNTHEKIPYYNAGCMLMNLFNLRNDRKDDEIIHAINTTRFQHMEQDALNFFCDKHILPLPSEYNASFVSDPTDHPRILHFLDRAKPQLPAAQKPYENLNWKDIKYAKE